MKKAEELFIVENILNLVKRAEKEFKNNPGYYLSEDGDSLIYILETIVPASAGIYMPGEIALALGLDWEDFDLNPNDYEDDESVFFEEISQLEDAYYIIDRICEKLSDELNILLEYNIEGNVYIGFDHNGEFSLIYVKNYIV